MVVASRNPAGFVLVVALPIEGDAPQNDDHMIGAEQRFQVVMARQ